MNRIISYTFFLLSIMTGGFAKIYANVKAPEESIAPTPDLSAVEAVALEVGSGGAIASTSNFSTTIIIILQILCLIVIVAGVLFIKVYIQRKGAKIQDKFKEMRQSTAPQLTIPNRANNDDLKFELSKTKMELREANELNKKLDQENIGLRSVISDLEEKNRSLIFKLQEKTKYERCSDSNVVAAQQEPESASNNQGDDYFDRVDLDRFYIETPSEEKSIHQSKLSKEFVARDHSYEVVIDRSKPNHAKFRIFKDANFKRMIEQPNRFITPACEYGDASFESDKNIEMIEAGILELNGEEWKLVEKARVKIV